MLRVAACPPDAFSREGQIWGNPVYDWVASAAARPVLQGLPHQLQKQFTAEYKAALSEAYPRTDLGTVLRFRRMFFIARRTG